MDLGIAGKVAVITGASRGIGRAIAISLAEEGAEVVLIARGAEDLEKTRRDMAKTGAAVSTIVGDVADPASCSAILEEVARRHSAVDILVNNVGGSLGSRGFDKVDDDAYATVMRVNFDSAVRTTRLALPLLENAKHAVIVNIASICAFELCGSAPYMAAKAAMLAFTKELSYSLAPMGVRAVTVSPGSILFPGGSWDKRARENPDMFRQVVEDIPHKRLGTPEEIASVVTFLASSKASWVTGVNITVDGGQSKSV